MGDSSCKRTAPIPLELASTDIFTGLVLLKYLSTGASVINLFSVLKLSACSGPQCHFVSFPSRALSGAAVWERFGMNFPRYIIIPKNLWRSFLLFGCPFLDGFYLLRVWLQPILAQHVSNVIDLILLNLASFLVESEVVLLCPF